MKKILVMMTAGWLTVASSMGAIDIALIVQSTAGINDPSLGAGPYGPGTELINLAIGSLYQLIWTTGGSASVIDPSNPLGLGAGEKLLQQWNTTVVGFLDTNPASYQSTDFALLPDGLVAGSVYLRVFNSGTPDGITGFYAGTSSPLVGGPLNDQSPGPNSENTVDIAPSSTYSLSFYQIVPEPSVLAFLGIGAALVGIRRMRRS